MSKGKIGSALARRRERLWAKDPLCPLCGVKTVLPRAIIGRYKLKDPGDFRGVPESVQDMMATIDHVRTKFDSRRRTNEAFGTRTRLMCKKCNNKLGDSQYNALPLENRQQRSRRQTRSRV